MDKNNKQIQEQVQKQLNKHWNKNNNMIKKLCFICGSHKCEHVGYE